MEGDWSSREGRLPRLDREGRTLSDSDYSLPSPPERDLSNIHLSQVSLDGGYGGDVSSETGSSEIFHHCQQPSYAHSEGYYSYVSSTDSITPFIDRLKRELEFTEIQENCTGTSSHSGSSNLKWEETDTESFVASRTAINKQDGESVWHMRGSSGDLVNTSYRPQANNARLSSPPLPDTSRLNYLSRIPPFHNASYDSVNPDHPSKLASESHQSVCTHAPRVQSSCIGTNLSKATRLSAALCRSSDSSNSVKLLSSLNTESSELPYSVRSNSNGPVCDNPSVRGHPHRESFIGRANKALSQSSHSSRIQSSNKDGASTCSNKIYAHPDSLTHSRTRNNLAEVPHHLSRVSTTINDSSNLSGKIHSGHKDPSVHPNRLHSNYESSNHMGRVHSNHNDSTVHSLRSHADSANHMNRVNSIHTDSASHINKVHSNHGDITNHQSKLHSNLDPSVNSNRKHDNHDSALHGRAPTNHCDSPAILNRIHPNLSDSNRAYMNHSESTGQTIRSHSNNSGPLADSNRPLCNNSETASSLPSRPHSNHSDSSGHSNKSHSSDSSIHTCRGQPIHEDTHSHPNKIHSSQSELTNVALVTRQNSSESACLNHIGRTHSSHCDPLASNNSSRVYASHGASNDLLTHPSRNLSNHSASSDTIGLDNLSRHSIQSPGSESSSTTLTSRLQSSHGNSSNESANIARSSRVPPPQRHLSQSVLYLSADHRKLFPISTYQPEPPRVVGAVSVSERVVELENRLGGLKALQKKALLSFYQRHQAAAPAPPPPPRRASSASDYLQLKGCIETSSISGSSQSSNGIKDTAPPACIGDSSLKDTARLLHRSCGSLSGISGPVIVGRSISVDHWVPARPPKGAHLRSTSSRPLSPEGSVHSSGARSNSPQPYAVPMRLATPVPRSPEKKTLNNATNSRTTGSHQTGSLQIGPRPASPEPPPPPASPPQQYSDEPLPPPPGPDELPPPPPSLPSRHPSPGPQVPTNRTESYHRSQSTNFKAPLDPQLHLRSTKNLLGSIENKHYYSPEKLFGNSKHSLDARPQKLSELSELKATTVSCEMQPQYNHRTTPTCSQKSLECLPLDVQSKSIPDHRSNRTPNSVSHLPLDVSTNGDVREPTSIDKLVEKLADNMSSDSKPIHLSISKCDLRESASRSNSEEQLDEKPLDSLCQLRSLPPTELNNSDAQTNPICKLLPDSEGYIDTQYNTSAIEPIQYDTKTQTSSSQVLCRSLSRDNVNQIKLQEKFSIDKGYEEPLQEAKKILRKTSFRCSERIQQSITSLQNSIRSSSPPKFDEVQKDVLSREILIKDMLKDIMAKEHLTKDMLSKDILPKSILAKEALTKDSVNSDTCKGVLPVDHLSIDLTNIISKESLSKPLTPNDSMSEDLQLLSSKEMISDNLSKDVICEDKWPSTVVRSEASVSELTSSLTKLDHLSLADKLISNYSSQFSIECIDTEDFKEELTSDCDIDKSSSSVTSQLESVISVGSLQQKKEELVSRLSRKLSVLRAEAAAVSEETSANEEVGEAVILRIAAAWGCREASRLRSHVADLGRLTALLLTLTTRLARADNALLALSSSHPDKGALETKRDRLAGQLEEARRLKEKVDRRNEAVTSKLKDRLNTDEYSDFMHFVSLKSKLLLDSREIADKIKLGEEQLQALQMTLSAVT